MRAVFVFIFTHFLLVKIGYLDLNTSVFSFGYCVELKSHHEISRIYRIIQSILILSVALCIAWKHPLKREYDARSISRSVKNPVIIVVSGADLEVSRIN